eukprot:scaffold109227_cov69-Phaeocystis_antarctica.AAC.2
MAHREECVEEGPAVTAQVHIHLVTAVGVRLVAAVLLEGLRAGEHARAMHRPPHVAEAVHLGHGRVG